MRLQLVLFVGLTVLFAGCAADGGAKASSPTNTVGTLELDDDSTLDRGAIVGKVVDDEQAPIAKARVGIVDLNAELETAEDGSFELKEVPVGSHSVVASRLGYDSVARKVEVVAGEATEVTIVLPALEIVESYFESIQKKTLFHVSETYITFAVNLTGQSPMCDGCVFLAHYTPQRLPDLILWEVFGQHTFANPQGDGEYAWAYANGANGAGGTLIASKAAALPLRVEFAQEGIGMIDKKAPLIWFQIMCETAWVCVEETRESWVTSFFGYEEYPVDFTARPAN